jgi:hypothetical protein
LDKGTINMTIRFAVIGINHNHIFGQVNALLGAGATFVGFFAPEDDLVADFVARYPQALLTLSVFSSSTGTRKST